MGTLVRYITTDGTVIATALNATDIAARAERIHKTSAVVSAALGRLLCAASMMGYSLKAKGQSITLRIGADGPVGTLLAVSDAQGNVRGYAENSIVELPLNREGKLDVGGAVGRKGTLQVIKDLNLKEPYHGAVSLISGEIAEDVAAYYAYSEQIPTVCALGVLVDRDLSVRVAGGYLIQLLPGAPADCIERLEQAAKRALPVTQMLENDSDPAAMLQSVMNGFALEALEKTSVEYACDCSRQRVERVLLSMGRAQLRQLADEQPTTEVACQFCEKRYAFTKEQVLRLAEK